MTQRVAQFLEPDAQFLEPDAQFLEPDTPFWEEYRRLLAQAVAAGRITRLPPRWAAGTEPVRRPLRLPTAASLQMEET